MARKKKRKGVVRRKSNRYRVSPEIKRERRKRTLLLAGYVCGFLVAVFIVSSVFVLGYRYLITTPYLRINAIEVQGCRQLSAQQVIRLSGVHVGQNLLAVNLKKIRKRIEINPWVEGVVINRVIPDKLVIEIEEKNPVALVQLRKKYLVDSRGKLIVPVKNTEGFRDRNYLVLTGLNEKEVLARGGVPADVYDQFRQFIAIGGSNGNWFDLGEIREVRWDPLNGLILSYGASNMVIKLGKGSFSLKFSMLRRVMGEISRRNIDEQVKEIDLRCSPRV
ncbi:MAG TPA: FtsQ-type POTRA domain-containing protein, partial [Deltaproteobacteria bacterium]|nr:FtsQ-type POTRA domain-containing protein [Deltaproteobacteria bacterium]